MRSRLPNTTPSRSYSKGPPEWMRIRMSRASAGSSRTLTSASESAVRRACAAGSSAASAKATTSACASHDRCRMRASVAHAAVAAAASGGFDRIARAHPDVQVAELLLGDGAGRADEQVLTALRLRERDDVADLIDTRHERHG